MSPVHIFNLRFDSIDGMFAVVILYRVGWCK